MAPVSYSPQVILDESGSRPWGGSEPFLVDGRIVADLRKAHPG
jgi:hypothetical protein